MWLGDSTIQSPLTSDKTLSHSSTHRIPAQIAFAGLTSELVSERSRVLALSALNQGKRHDEEKERGKKEGMGRDAEAHGSREDHRCKKEACQVHIPCVRESSNHCRTSQHLGDLSLLMNFAGA